MASSGKPDFIEIDEKEAPVELMTGADADVSEPPSAEALVGTGAASSVTGSSAPETVPSTSETAPLAPAADPAREVSNFSAPNSTPVPHSKEALHPKLKDDVLTIQKKSLPPRNSMRKLPGGAFFFIGLMIAICFWGSRLEEIRNQALTDLASGFLVDQKGFVETVSDLSTSYSQHNNIPAAKRVLEKALSDLSLKGEDKGAKGAYIRLKDAMLDFQSDKFNAAKIRAFEALSMLKSGGTYVPYDMGFLLYDVGWLFDNNWDYKDGVLFNKAALDVWPKERPNYRADVVADIGFEYNRLKQFDKAEVAFKEALNQSLRHGDSGNNVWRYSQLGQAQVGQKKYMEAEINLNAALRMEGRLHQDRKTTHLAQIYTDLGRVKAGLGDMKSAQDYLEKSAKILKKKKNETYYYLINQLELANLYRDTGHPEKARPLYGELLRRLNDGEFGPSRKDVTREFDLLLAQTGGK